MATSIDISQVYNYYITAGATPSEAADYTAYYIADVYKTKKVPSTPKFKTTTQLYRELAPNYTSFVNDAQGNEFATTVSNMIANGDSYKKIQDYVYSNKDLLKDYYTVVPKGSSRESSFMNIVGRAKTERDTFTNAYNKQQAALSYSGLGGGGKVYDFNVAGKYTDENTVEYKPYRQKYTQGKEAITKILNAKGIKDPAAQKTFIDKYNKAFETAAKTNIANIETSPLLDQTLGRNK
jgi:hypothetical protein